MKGDIAFVGFMLTAEEWQELDADARAQLIAVATRRVQPPPPPRRFPDGTGKHEVLDVLDEELDKLLVADDMFDDGVLADTVLDHRVVADDSTAHDDKLEDFADWADL
jgi:hypothetical protein